MEKLTLDVLKNYKEIDVKKIDRDLEQALEGLNRKIVVLDDDPTGVQTVHDVSVYTSWDMEAITSGFNEDNSIFFILTNSRGFTKEETVKVHSEIAVTLTEVSKNTGKDYILISRSDSTMRGYYPVETATLKGGIEGNSEKRFDGEIIFPFFKEGGRFTIGNVHYVKEGDFLTPAGQTEFAKDKSFGYKSSHIGEYVEEKTSGLFRKEDCTYISLEDIRNENIQKITAQLMAVRNFNKVIVNAIDYVDVKVFALAYINAIKKNKEFIFRSAAAVTKVLGGVRDIPLLSKEKLIEKDNKNGGVILIGSHVNKTTQQFEALKGCKNPLELIEFNQHLVLEENGLQHEVMRVIAEAEKHIKNGKNVVVYTRRERFDLETDDKDKQLMISVQISDAVTSIIGKLSIRPNFIIAKGGITSSDVGTKALKVKKALVMGQIKPGIPVWMTGTESKFPQMPYIIFPGNVGEIDTLKEIVDLLS
ncbi:MAG TPA: four-carbon acid sugar kinase family protein [Patescibacteria group bacterium]|nr:four-carbon acid sugar kinase family protein [Patescibacteria group bacterium]